MERTVERTGACGSALKKQCVRCPRTFGIMAPMLPQYVITLGARTEFRTAAGSAGKFEDDDYRTIERIVREEHGFEGGTIIRARGFYGGQEEDTVQIILLEKNYEKVQACAQELRAAFGQQSVLVICSGVGEFLADES